MAGFRGAVTGSDGAGKPTEAARAVLIAGVQGVDLLLKPPALPRRHFRFRTQLEVQIAVSVADPGSEGVASRCEPELWIAATAGKFARGCGLMFWPLW